MVQDWPELTKLLNADVRQLRAGAPDVMKAFGALALSASGSKALDAKTKELIALAIGVSTRCDDCIAFHS
jgi:alkylhydroperoxidase/carboxymuconolactone decarboxylase family protein YurZ